MKIEIPKIDLTIPKTEKKLQLFIGINLTIDNEKVLYSGGFVKERMGTSQTVKAKQNKKKEDKKQGESLQSTKSGEVII